MMDNQRRARSAMQLLSLLKEASRSTLITKTATFVTKNARQIPWAPTHHLRSDDADAAWTVTMTDIFFSAPDWFQAGKNEVLD